MGRYDPFYRCQPQAGSVRLVGKEGIKYLLQQLWSDTTAEIRDFEETVVLLLLPFAAAIVDRVRAAVVT